MARTTGNLAQTNEAHNPGSTVTVGTTSAEVAAANPNRIELFVTNTHATQSLSLSLGGTAVANEGIVLAAGQSIVIDSFNGQVNGIGSGLGTTVAVAEA